MFVGVLILVVRWPVLVCRVWGLQFCVGYFLLVVVVVVVVVLGLLLLVVVVVVSHLVGFRCLFWLELGSW